jgi:hypothetical protein
MLCWDSKKKLNTKRKGLGITNMSPRQEIDFSYEVKISFVL